MKKKMLALSLCGLLLLSLAGGGLATEGDQPGQPPTQDGAPPQGTPPDGQGGTLPEGDAPPDMPGGQGGPGGDPGADGQFGGSGTVTQGDAATTIDSDAQISQESYSSTNDNENALRVTGPVQVSLQDITVTQSGGTANTEDSDFYGQNAALLATDGAQVTLTGATIQSDASGGNAVFSYGSGTNIQISDSVIRTSLDHSGGVHVAGGGSLTASNLDIETQGSSAAAVRSDRGGGTLAIQGGTYVSNGTGSPAVYSTATITAQDAVLTAKNAEAIVVEGKHSIALVNSDVTGNMSADFLADVKDTTHNIMIYQSMSGDAEQGQSSFSMQGGSLTANSGEMFYVTNTDCTIDLSGVSLTLADNVLLRVAGNNAVRGWGQAGSNGGACAFTADAQTLSGQVLVDDISTLALALTGSSHYTGSINPDGDAGQVDVRLSADSTWTLTADSYVGSFDGDLQNVNAGDYHLYVGGDLAV